MGYPRLDESHYEEMIYHRGEGLNNEEIAKVMGISSAAVGYTFRAYDAVRKQDWKRANEIMQGHCSLSLFEWCARRCGVKLPPSIAETYYKRAKKNRPCEAPIQETKPIDAQKTNEDVFFSRLLEMQMQQAELLQNILKKLEDMQLVINTFYLQYIPDKYIPEITKTFVDTFNANADVINATLMDIRQNTRRR